MARPRRQDTSPPVESGGAVFLRIRTADGFPQFRRCGRLFSSNPSIIAVAELTEDEIKRINETPALVVELVTAVNAD